VIFIESRPFTRRLYQLRGAADELLRAIHGELMKEPGRDDMVLASAVCAKPVLRIPAVARENVAATAIVLVPGEEAAHPLADFAR